MFEAESYRDRHVVAWQFAEAMKKTMWKRRMANLLRMSHSQVRSYYALPDTSDSWRRFLGIERDSGCANLTEQGPGLGAFRSCTSVGDCASIAPGDNTSVGKHP